MTSKAKIRVLYCLQSITTGGVEMRRLLLSRHLDRNQFELMIICTASRGKIVEEMEANGMQVIPIGDFKSPFDFKQYGAVLKVIKKFRPHIIHGGVFEGVTMACVAGKIGNVPVIIAEETSDPKNRSKKASILLRILTSVADKVIAIAPNVAGYLEGVAKIPLKKIITINNGVEIPQKTDPETLRSLRAKYAIGKDDLVIGSVGRLHEDHKRFSDIIKAIAILNHNAHIRLLIVGSGNDEAIIVETAKVYGLEKQLIMAGFQHDTAPFYQLMDIFCLASQREGFGLVAAEAMLNQLPVVATRVGGLQDIVIDNTTGYLVPPMQPNELAKKLQQLIDDAKLRKTMGVAGYKRAIVEYTAEVYVAKVEQLYHKLLIDKKVQL